ncbi:MAG: glycosyltransferase family 2 protein [Planctomycetes bacterium]|nr:glycosyltransferase family 2 protein [Planctomycetota bacterium]
MSLPRVSFGIIVLNGEPFTRYSLRALYPFAHEIIVVEGACRAAAGCATVDGHSTDATREVLARFQAEEDPENKVKLITAEDMGHPDGFWPGEKDEQSRAYAQAASGDWLWQVDIDEFYQPGDLEKVCKLLADNPELTGASFPTLTFWGGFDACVDSWYLRRGGQIFHRLFRWGEGYIYVSHRPPTVLDPQGRDLRNLNWLDADAMSRQGIYLYHYSLVFPKQVWEKCHYYSNAEWTKRAGAEEWYRDNFLNLQDPYHLHNVYTFPGWLEPFKGSHPPAISSLRQDLASGELEVELRPAEDIKKLLASPLYRMGCGGLRVLNSIAYGWQRLRHRLRLGRWRMRKFFAGK